MRRTWCCALAGAAVVLLSLASGAEGAAKLSSVSEVPVLVSAEGRQFYAYAPSVIQEEGRE